MRYKVFIHIIVITALLSCHAGETFAAGEPELEVEEEEFIPPPDFLVVQIPKGEWAGQTLGWLAENDPDYLQLVADGAKDPSVREAAQLTIEWAAGQMQMPL